MSPREQPDLKVPSATPQSDFEPTQAMASGVAADSVIGHYRLLQKIGEGGMGEVWLAEQKEPVRRRVALKLVKEGMNTREVMARFESERQALALMNHPAIAKVFDAGTTSLGAPYFVMEYVAGAPITAYCDQHQLGTRERLDLFRQVCEGVQHAHQKAIIHRDLKPSNILVTELDGKPAPKIIDFGVAKALAQKLTAETLYTRVGAIVGTPEYMSPEQALSSGEDIDTRSDVYSMGIVLYELLAGAPPLELRKISLEEFLRRLREEEPLKPSTRIRTRDEATTEVARKRKMEPLALAKQLRGDLDAIVLKALEKERARRYDSPAALAADIGRYLNHEAVLAVAPSAAYRARKYARRHRAALATAVAFVLVLIGGAAISIRQSIRANTEAAVAQAVSDFLQKDVLAQASAYEQAGPAAKPDPHLEVRTALDRAATRIAGKFDRQPEVEAAIRDTIGSTYKDLGLYAEARAQLETALALHRRVLAKDNPKVLKTMSNLATIARWQGRYPEAETLYSQALEGQRRVLGPERPETLASMSGLASTYEGEGKYAQAEPLQRQTLEIFRRVRGPEHQNTLALMNNLALTYIGQGKYGQAEALQRETLEIDRRVLGPEYPDTLNSINNLATTYGSEGKYAEAEALVSQNLEIERSVLGPEHSLTLSSLFILAKIYEFEGRYAESEAVFAQVLEIYRRVLGPDHPKTLYSLAELAATYLRQGKYALAETTSVQALAGLRHVLGAENRDAIASVDDLALAYQMQGKFVESEPLAREALELCRKKLPDDWQRFRAESLLGASLAGQKKYTEAQPLLLEGYQGMLARKDKVPVAYQYHLDRAHEWTLQLYQAWGKPEKVAEWSKK